jgi:serine/threonine-protein kinase
VTPERWREIQALFNAALERAPEEDRVTFLREACGDDAALLAELESLLRADASGASVLDTRADRALGLAAASPGPGARVGPYELLGSIGTGGMGEVFLARRAEGGFDQRVAIKLIRPDAGSAQVLGRFTRERQILARLSHPNIAHLLDGGAAEDGRPYFVMEHIEGEPIDDYCRRRGARLGERLRLMIDVCAAVHHAHRSLVIHRDLKPDNILVTADGTAKLLDFGIARVVDPDEGLAVALTDPRQRVLTPQYAAPEQVRGEPVTTATDVYALGVLLYELVAGELPYSTRDVPPSQLERVIGEARILPPSRVASRERVPPALDAACLRALERDPDRRYASAAELGATLEALLAPPPRRRRWLLLAIGIALAVAALAGFAIGRWAT